MGYSLCMMADFENALISYFSNIWCFLERFFAENNCKRFVEWILTCFFGILIFEPKSGFCIGYRVCMMADIQNALISHLSNIWCFLERFFCKE